MKLKHGDEEKITASVGDKFDSLCESALWNETAAATVESHTKPCE